jgi:hypothetical protein
VLTQNSDKVCEQIEAVISALVRRELDTAPQPVIALFQEMLPMAEMVPVGQESLALRDSYLRAKDRRAALEYGHASSGGSHPERVQRDCQLELQAHRELPQDPVV